MLKRPIMRAFVVGLFTLSALAGCNHPAATFKDAGGDPTGPGDMGAPPDGYFAPSAIAVSGQVVDFESGQAMAGAATVATAALLPPPAMTTTGADFSLEVPPDSAFFLVAAAVPDHRTTYNPPTVVTTMPLTKVEARTLAEAYVTRLATAFNVTPVANTAIVLAQAVDAAGAPLAGVDGSMLTIDAPAAKGPFYLDAKLEPQAAAKATSASGWLVWFDVPAGMVQLAAKPGTIVKAAATPTAANAVSLVVAAIDKGTAPTAGTVSFGHDVLPIFIKRGCYNCHSGNGDGRRLGDLVLDGAPQKIFAALTTDISPNFKVTRVNKAMPEKSLVLTMPSFETPPDAHPTVVFTGPTDVDYVTILNWIKQGATLN